MVAMNLNSNCYVIAIDNASKSATLNETDANTNSLVIYNGSTTPVFVVSAKGSAATAVFPTSATVPLKGKVIGPGATQTFTKNPGHNYISAIQAVAGTGSLYIHSGTGE